MASADLSAEGCTVILGTGGTIAGRAASGSDNVGYTAAQLSVASLVAGVPALAAWPIEAEQVAQLDSKDMTHSAWAQLAQRAAAHLARPKVDGIVVTHGTDTLEETAYFLHRMLGPTKPVVLTAAMRPATSLQADGPQNLLDAVTMARERGACGVVVAMGGRVHRADEIRKIESYRIDAFSSGQGGPLALIEEGVVRQLRPWPDEPGLGLSMAPAGHLPWPWVEIVLSHADADPRAVDALTAAGVRGLVVAGTGNGTVHEQLQPALQRAQAAGVEVLVTSRCAFGGVVGGAIDSVAWMGRLSAPQARVELLLRLLARDAQAR